jgi:hypothetical protein
MIAITTRSSTNVKPNRKEWEKEENFVEKTLENKHFSLSILLSILQSAPPPLAFLSCPF